MSIDSAHRLLAHKGKCSGLHGHRYDFLLTVEIGHESVGTGHKLIEPLASGWHQELANNDGMIIDFDDIKSTVGKWLNETLDHATILQVGDPLIPALAADERTKLVIMQDPPTAECLALYVLEQARRSLAAVSKSVFVTGIEVYETPNGKASACDGF
jgi:6-pyruvoyltetrahydropterin/6-carboxytetrahydropterin synthase